MIIIKGISKIILGKIQPICTFDLMKKLLITFALIFFCLFGYTQSSNSKAMYSPGVVRIEMEKAGMKLSHDQFMKLQKAHQEYQTKINESTAVGNETQSTRYYQSYNSEVARILNPKQLEKFNKMQREGINAKPKN